MKISSTQRPHRARTAFITSGVSAGLGYGASALAFTDTVITDKQKHIGIAGAATLALSAAGVKPELAAAGVFVGASVGKELILDKLLGYGTPSWLDTAANAAGVLGALAVVKFVEGSAAALSPREKLLGH